MRRLIGKIGVKSPAEIERERREEAIVLPHYVQAWRRGSVATTIIVTGVTRAVLSNKTLWITGRDQHKTWGWTGLYDTHGNNIGKRSEYAPPSSIFPNFVPTLLECGYIHFKDAGGRPSGKQTYDLARWRRFKEGTNHENDDEWRSHLNEKQFNQFMFDGTYPL